MAKVNVLKEIAGVFLKLGLFAFGGPAAHIAMMEEEIVSRRGWMSRQHFLDLIGATNLIPGPNSTEMTMHCGYERGGRLGLFIAGICFIFPAVCITLLLAWIYVEYGSLPEIQPMISGILPAVLVIIAAAILKLGKKAFKNLELIVVGIVVLVASLFGVNEIIALLAGGLLGGLYFYFKSSDNHLAGVAPILPIFLSSTIVAKLSTAKIFWTFLKVGSILYGSGYVLFAYLDAELVSNGWLSRPDLMEAIGIGQFTPGPVLSTATFIGYQLGGFWGALAATAGIFLPSFIFVWILNPLIPKMQRSRLLRAFLDSVNVAAVAVMIAVLILMTRETLVDIQSMVIVAICGILFFGFKRVNSVMVILTGLILGYLFYLFQ